jgi:hypothetical protein
MKLAIPHRTNGRVLNHLPGRSRNGLGIEPEPLFSRCDESEIAQVSPDACSHHGRRQDANRFAGGKGDIGSPAKEQYTACASNRR